jgi:hypothetical protein
MSGGPARRALMKVFEIWPRMKSGVEKAWVRVSMQVSPWWLGRWFVWPVVSGCGYPGDASAARNQPWRGTGFGSGKASGPDQG